MTEYIGCLDLDLNSLTHHGVLGMKWGVRNYQNLDGSLTTKGRFHYGFGYPKSAAKSFGKFFGNLKGTNLSDIKTDALDYANQKGFLDFLDSKASDNFSSIRSASNPKESGYESSASKDPFRAMKNMERYLDMEGYGGRTTNSSRYDNRFRDSEKFAKAMDFITDPSNKRFYANGKKWMDVVHK